MNLDPNTNQPRALAHIGAAELTSLDGASVDLPTALESEVRGGLGESSSARPFSPWQLLEYKWSILGTFVLVAALGVAGIWLLLVPLYKATANIEVSPVIPQWTGKSDMVQGYEIFINSQPDIIRHPIVLNGVLDDAKVRETRWYRAVPASPLELLLDRMGLRSVSPPLDRLIGDLTAERPKGKQIVVVSMKSPTPGEAKLIVDKVLDHYLRFTNERASMSDTEQISVLRKWIGGKPQSLERILAEAAEIRQRLSTDDPAALIRELVLRLVQLEDEIARLKRDIAVAESTPNSVPRDGAPAATPPEGVTTARSDAVESATSAPSTPPSWESPYAADPVWWRLQERLAGVEREFNRRAERFGESDSRLQALRAEQDDLNAQLRVREGHLDQFGTRGLADSSPGPRRESLPQMTKRLELLAAQLEADREKVKAAARDAERLAQLTADADGLRAAIQKREQDLEEIERRRELAGQVRTFLAVELALPDNDKRWKLTAAALVGALAFAVGLAFLRIKLSPTVDRVVELARPVQGAFLGHLPLGRTTGALRPELSALHLESVRMIRTALLNRLGGVRGVVVQITSATVGSGKSTLAVLLARSLAQSGQRVLLVDSDLRRPTLAARLALAPQPGLCDILADRRATPGIQSVADAPGLSVLPAGVLAHDADRELITNGVFSSLLDQWRASFDQVLLDSAPLLGLADAAILAGRVDGTVLVVREHHCRREAVLEALAVLGAAGGRLLGTVFVGSGRVDHYGYAHGYGYGYGCEHTAVTPEPVATTVAPQSDAPRHA